MLYLAIFQLLIISLIPKKNIIVKLIVLIIAMIFSIQISTLVFSGYPITPLALSNISYIQQVGKMPIIYFAISMIAYLIASYYLSSRKIFNKKNITILLICLTIVLSVFKNSPIGSLSSSIYTIYKQKKILQNNDTKRPDINEYLRKENVVVNTTSHTYIDNKKYNVIVIFVEGMSYDIISQNLTPNLYSIINSSINVTNYHNHTAATYRGLRGQLTSSYQMTSGFYQDPKSPGLGQITSNEIKDKFKNTELSSLPEILQKNGYGTFFQSSNSKNNQLSIMLSTLGFTDIYGYEDHKNKQKWSINELTDKESFELLLQNSKKLPEPFFYGMYTVGTHVGLDSPNQKFNDGKNNYLNMFWNLDYSIGKFFNTFNNSNLADNTILIITADHSTYTTPEFKKTFNIENNDFVDTIPFIIYKKGVEPIVLDVNGMNSLSLAPTILDMLGIHSEKNIFLGQSIFDTSTPKEENFITAIGLDYFKTTGNTHTRIDDKSVIERVQHFQSLGK